MDSEAEVEEAAAALAAVAAEAEEEDAAAAAAAAAEDEAVLARAERLISRIVASQASPSPRAIHALASILEVEEGRYLETSANATLNNGRSSHTIGKLGRIIKENDDFFELISSKFLSDNRYSTSIRAASARLLLSCSATLMYPHAFEDMVLENIKRWVIDDPLELLKDEVDWKVIMGSNKPTNGEMLRTYATGLLCIALTAGGPVVEDVVTSELSAKLMRYLRLRVLGESTITQREAGYAADGKHISLCGRVREDGRSRHRQARESANLDSSRVADEPLLDDQSVMMNHPRADASDEVVGMYESVADETEQTEEERRLHSRDLRDIKGKSRSNRDDDSEENPRDDLSRRRGVRGWGRIRGKGRPLEGCLENERDISPSPVAGVRSGGSGHNSVREKNPFKHLESKSFLNKSTDDGLGIERDDDYRLKECEVGTRNILEFVKKAIRAAEAEARTANAPAEAILAAGDAAAELVKTTALEVLRTTNDEEAAVAAASNAASTVVEAAIATEVSRNSLSSNIDSEETKSSGPEEEEDLDDLFILDDEALRQLREKYCIQCLEVLGEYFEVLGPVLQEKGVDVCLELLQRCSNQKDTPENVKNLSEVLKLICSLAAHKKFAALFVDREGMQKLLAVHRNHQTYVGLSLCLFTIGSLQGIMERVCRLASEVVHQVVELALQLLECSQDQARKNAAVFFASAFVFRAVLDSFDYQEGLQKMLNLLQNAASVRSGNNSSTLAGTSSTTPLRNDRTPAEVLTTLEKQVAYHTCVALRQYFRAQLLLLVDSLRPNKSHRSTARNISGTKPVDKPLDVSNEAMEAVFLQIQRDRKVGPAFVRARWSTVDRFLTLNGHVIILELCQAPPAERYLHDLAQYALGVLHIVTLVPYSRKLVINATLSNDRVGMAVILDAANGAGYVDPEIIHPALSILVNLACPPPSISIKPPGMAQGQQSSSVQVPNGSTSAADTRERQLERNVSERNVLVPNQVEPTSGAAVASGVVGDRRITLGQGAGCAGLAAQLELGYRQAREAVRANNGIKVLLHLLHPRIFTPPAALDCLRALACRVLLGLARDNTIAHILTKLQVGKKLSELIRDSGFQATGTEQGKWQAELAQVAIELIAIVTNSGRASTLAATDAAAPTLRRIERAAIAAATPITYHSRELLLLIHEHLQASGLTTTAAALLYEARLTPLPSSSASSLHLHQTSIQEIPSSQFQWPSGRIPGGFLSEVPKTFHKDDGYSGTKPELNHSSSKKKLLVLPSNLSPHGKSQTRYLSKTATTPRTLQSPALVLETPSTAVSTSNLELESVMKTPIQLPMKRKLNDGKGSGCSLPSKRSNISDQGVQSPVCQTPILSCRNGQSDGFVLTPSLNLPEMKGTPSCTLPDNQDGILCPSTQPFPSTPSIQPGILADYQGGNTERVSLDSLVVQYLKHQHRQCPTPITTLPPLSLLHPHVCPEPSRNFDAPTNITSRLSRRECRYLYGGTLGFRKDRQFVYSRFRPWRTCRDDTALLSCMTFLGDSARIATGSHSGELKIFDSSNGNILESQTCHQSSVTMLQSVSSGPTQLLITSSSYDVRLWDVSSVSVGPLNSFDGCKAARFSHSGTMFAALSAESSHKEVLLYDVETGNVDLKFSDNSNPPSGPLRGHVPSLIHFSPLDTMLLWNGVLWDRRGPGPVHRFDQFTDYGGGGFHPSGNEIIINSEVWDLRRFKLLRSVPSLDQTVVTFNTAGDVIYAILRRNLEDITSAVQTRRFRHPLYPAFRTIDAVNYSDIATIPVDRCVLDFATEPTDSFIGVVAMDDHEDMLSSARLYEIGRRRSTDDDSDPDDGAETDEDEEDDESEIGDGLVGADLDGDLDSDVDDLMSNDEDDDSIDDIDDDEDEDDDGEFNTDFDGGRGMFEIGPERDDDDDSDEMLESFSSDEDDSEFGQNGFGF